MSVCKVKITIWPATPEGKAGKEAHTRTVVFPPDEWGTFEAATERLKAEIESNKADGMIDHYEIVDVPTEELDEHEAMNWLEEFREQ